MAQDIQFSERRAILLKMQTDTAVPETLSATDDALLCYDLNAQDMEDPLERDIDLIGHGARPSVGVNNRISTEFGIELRGAATVGTASPIGRALRCCGFAQTLDVSTPGSESAIYSLIGTGFEEATMRAFSNGTEYPAANARGALTRLELSRRNFGRGMVTLLGRKIAAAPVADAALPAAVYTAFQSPVPITTDSFDVLIGADKRLNTISVNLDMGAQAVMHEGSETQFAYLSGLYRPTGTLRVYKEQRSNFNPNAIADTRVRSDVVATVTGGGEVLRVLLKSVEFGRPTDSEEDGLAAWDIPFRVVGTTQNDAVSIGFLAIP